MAEGIKQQQIVLNNLLVNYYSVSGDNQNSLLFLHGWRSNSTLWFKVFPKLTELGYHIYALDLPGFGKSEKLNKDFTLQNYVETVKEFIKKLKIDKPTIVGHSHGGRIGIILSAQIPENIDNLILVDSGGIKPESISLTFKKTLAKIVKPIFSLSFMKPLKSSIYRSMGSEDYIATPELRQTFLNIINEDLRDRLHEVKNRTLLIWGEKDSDTPLSDGLIMKNKIPNSKLAVIKDAGHYSFLDKPEAFSDILISFLKDN